ncbi:hypothetical protein DY000_02024076 [Brassica cretica]|uniref:DUF4283 domain-containing protein n=1 Tax=Brassica cretica TaxID=69181 RepID=A0ABQ7EMH0_BRACR|nr:hypothetical protein DY000_02024076 [Brassica cretica]
MSRSKSHRGSHFNRVRRVSVFMETEYRKAEIRSPTETRRQPIRSNLLETRRVPEPNQRIGCGQSEERLEQMWWSAGDLFGEIPVCVPIRGEEEAMDIVICRGPWTFADIIMLVLQRWTPNHGTDSTFVREEKLDGIADDGNMHSMELFDEIQNVKWFGALSVLTLVMLISYHQSLEDESTRELFVNANPGLLWKESVDDKPTWVKDVNNLLDGNEDIDDSPLSLVKDPSLAKPLGRNVFLWWLRVEARADS